MRRRSQGSLEEAELARLAPRLGLLLVSLTTVVNAVYIGLDTDYAYSQAYWVEYVFVAVYVGEWLVRLRGTTWYHQVVKGAADPNRSVVPSVLFYFNTLLIALAFMELGMGKGRIERAHGETGLLALRVLRVPQTLQGMGVFDAMGSSFGRLLYGLLKSLRNLLWLLVTFLLLFYIYAVLGTYWFGQDESLAGDELVSQLFGTVPASLSTLLAVATLDDWSENARYVAYRLEGDKAGLVWVYHISFILLVALNCLSLWNAVFVEAAITVMKESQSWKKRQHAKRIAESERKLYQAFQKMDLDGNGFISAPELKRLAESKTVVNMLKELGIRPQEVRSRARGRAGSGRGD